MSSRRICRSCLFALPVTAVIRWLANGASRIPVSSCAAGPSHRPRLATPPARTRVPFGRYHPPEFGQRTVSHGVGQDVVALRAVGEVFLGVVDDVVGADRPGRRWVRHTPVTCALEDLAICMANVPMPPAAPLMSTFCPGWIGPAVRRARRAAIPAMGTAAACANVRVADLVTSRSWQMLAYSAKAPVADLGEHRIGGPEPGHVRAGRLDLPGHAAAQDHGPPGLAHAQQDPDEQGGIAAHGTPVMRIGAGPHQHLARPGRRHGNVPGLPDLAGAVRLEHDGLHRLSLCPRRGGAGDPRLRPYMVMTTLPRACLCSQ